MGPNRGGDTPGYTRTLPLVLGGAATGAAALAFVLPWAAVWVSLALLVIAVTVLTVMPDMRGESMIVATGLTLFSTILSAAIIILLIFKQ